MKKAAKKQEEEEKEEWWETMEKVEKKQKEEKKEKARRKKQKEKAAKAGKAAAALGIRGGNTGHKGIYRRDILEVNRGGGAARGITIDSAAEESVCPPSWGHREFGLMGFGNLGKLDFRAANGSRIQHFGRRKCLFKGLGKKVFWAWNFRFRR